MTNKYTVKMAQRLFRRRGGVPLSPLEARVLAAMRAREAELRALATRGGAVV